MDRNEQARERVRKAYEEKYGERDRKREVDQKRAERSLIAKSFHGNDAPDYPDLDRDCCMAVVQVYHERPFDIASKAAVQVNRAASMVEWSRAELTVLRDFVGDLVAACTRVLGASAAPINIQPDVFEVMTRIFNRFIDLCASRRPDLCKKWRKWEKFDADTEMEE